MKRVHYIFHGRVQGVGFRFTAQAIAKELKLSGWVRNEYDGTVSVQLQGSDERQEQFLRELRENRFIQIDEIERCEMPLVEGETRFSIDY